MLTSFSRLELFLCCPQKYKLRYIDGTPHKKEINEHLMLGTLVHGVLEEILDPETSLEAGEAFALYLGTWMNEVGLPADLQQDLLDFAPDYARLLQRASPEYFAADSIRNKDGSPPRDLQNFPPGSWTAALRAQKLSTKKMDIDNAGSTACALFRDISLAHLVGTAFYMSVHFVLPEWFAETLAVEKGISDPGRGKKNATLKDPVLFPGSETLHLQAYLDWVVKTTDGRIAIIDHKTSKKAPTEAEVVHHPQLNLYAWLWYKFTGRFPELIGIHHLASHSFVMVNLETEALQGVLRNTMEVQSAIDSGIFPKRYPGAYNSPCLSRDYRSGEVKEVCSFVSLCWPSFAASLQEEGVEIFDPTC